MKKKAATHKKKTGIALIALLFAAGLSAGSAGKSEDPLRLATTTSVENSGLLDYLLPAFEKATGIKVHAIAVGTGKALKLAENGDVDLVLVHSPPAEEKFIAAGYGVNRREVMENDFIIVGPEEDPAGVSKAKDLVSALKLLQTSKDAVFISRADDSGTHKKELTLWKKAGGPPPPERYLEIGQGMEVALRMAWEKKAYTLSDRGTWLALRKRFPLRVVFEGSEELLNIYSVIAVNPARRPGCNYLEAMIFIAWITSPEAQALISRYRVDGEVLFKPRAVPLSALPKAGTKAR